ncbi:MAG: hypothetical protein CM1200mP18_06520 [Gammaproteobacteria bacterium]|nr:MAG: hypothetical protein CM1200mP18_06520 [Gammaproteobacteria bacterium]
MQVLHELQGKDHNPTADRLLFLGHATSAADLDAGYINILACPASNVGTRRTKYYCYLVHRVPSSRGELCSHPGPFRNMQNHKLTVIIDVGHWIE